MSANIAKCNTIFQPSYLWLWLLLVDRGIIDSIKQFNNNTIISLQNLFISTQQLATYYLIIRYRNIVYIMWLHNNSKILI